MPQQICSNILFIAESHSHPVGSGDNLYTGLPGKIAGDRSRFRLKHRHSEMGKYYFLEPAFGFQAVNQDLQLGDTKMIYPPCFKFALSLPA